MFVFGGKTKEEGGLSNELWILIMGKKPLKWVQRVTKGKPPCIDIIIVLIIMKKGIY